MKRAFSCIITICLIVAYTCSSNSIEAMAANNPVVIVIDPGHGGEGGRNLGATYNGLIEKDLTMRVATAMKQELEKYDGVVVYLTRSSDQNVSLEDRAAFAKSVNADFMYSIHFNASSEHAFYGSEIWTSAFGTNFQKGFDFGQIESGELSALSLYQKGVKTKLGSSGKDYYGIIRHSVANEIPCVIIEHAYLDHIYDVQYLRDSSFFSKLGVADATAVAKYYKLKSSKTGADFSSYNYTSIGKPSKTVKQDTTEPEVCKIKALAYDSASRNALIELTTNDSGSPVIYFSYSYDGGATFSKLQMWDRTKKTQSFNVNIPSGITSANIVVRSYNNYELFSQSNEVKVETR